MQDKTVEVKSQSNVVGTANYKEYETVAEAVSDLGEAKLLENLNAQVRTNAMNAVRAGATGKPSKKWLTTEAMNELVVENAFAAVAGDRDGIQRLIDERVAAIEKREDAKRAAQAAAAKAASDEGDEE